jgi:hypothetical protein
MPTPYSGARPAAKGKLPHRHDELTPSTISLASGEGREG